MLTPLLAHLLDAAGRAPSAHNTQPWRIRPTADGLEVLLRPERALPAGDPSGNDALHAIGALLENLLLTLEQLGHSGQYETTGRLEPGRAIVTLRWRANADRRDPSLYRMIPVRRTSRLPYRLDPIPAEEIAAMRSAATPCSLHSIDDAARLGELRRLVKEATERQLADAPIARELHTWLRFSRRDPRWYRDGLNADCLGWSRLEAAAASVLMSPRVLGWLARAGLHRLLAADPDQHMPPTPMVCLLATPVDGVASRVEAGRSLQRAWLTAAAHGLVTHPVSAALDDAATRPRALALFGLEAGLRPVNLFRLGASPPPARSPRLPVDEILDSGPVMP